ncbi:MAG TPA: class I SAM-dependent methyltransferase [Desulfomonilaceae bacterium]|nr:class I SAM-dependent methyltransferase [Desulfomonilaceae bacterium]
MVLLEPDPPPGAGKSSFELIEIAKLFQELNLTQGMVFADLGCGFGRYSVAAAEFVGATGMVHALDLWPEGIRELSSRVSSYTNIRPVIADVGERLPLPEGSVDVCFMATVLHDLVQTDKARAAVKETARVLKPDGVLAIVEFKKIPGPPGPPAKIRLDPKEVESIVLPEGFVTKRFSEIGPYHYLLLFSRSAGARG